MQQKGELISFRPDIKVVDCTIRDGGLVNNFYFDDEFVKDYIKQMLPQALIIWSSVIRLQRICLT